jgi:hypothetical protein
MVGWESPSHKMEVKNWDPMGELYLGDLPASHVSLPGKYLKAPTNC